MRIAIDIRPTLKKQKTGIGYYTLNLVNSLSGIDGQNDYLLYSRIRPFSMGKELFGPPAANFTHKIDRFGLGPAITLKGIDVFHSSSFDLKPPKRAKFVLTVHDLIPKIFPQGHTQDAINRFKASLPAALDSADVIVTDSECTARDLLRHYPGRCRGKIMVVYPGVGGEFEMFAEDSKNLYKKALLKYNLYFNYIIYIGTLEPRKNVEGLIRAYHILKKRHGISQQLVITGMKGWSYEGIFRLVEELSLDKDVVFTGYVPREELKIFYNFASLSVYPSFYEGAGLPVLESFKCGCPVVTSKVSCMPEFAGDAAVLIDPHNIESIAEGIHTLLSDEGLRGDMRQKGLKRASEFTWAKTARQVLNVFDEVTR